MVAQLVELNPYELVISLDDAHIYHKHFDAVREQLTREPLPLPTLRLNPRVTDIDQFGMNDIRIENYQHHARIVAPFQG